MEHMTGISIGPVQGFIAAARKTRDLWFGSYMLSEISRAVASELKQSSASMIFPPESCIESDSPVGNKIYAVVPSEIIGSIEKLVKEAANKKIEEFKMQTLEALNGIEINREQFDAQIAGFLEIYIAWWPSGDDYRATRKNLDQLLAGRKALRDFAPAVGLKGVPKSSLDGGMDSILLNVPTSDTRVKPSELLDAISLVKRLARPKRFVSVSRIAVDGFIRNLSRKCPDQLQELVKLARDLVGTDYVQPFDAKRFEPADFSAFPYDTRLFYMEESSSEIRGNDSAVKFIRTVKTAAGKLGAGAPNSYFAVLVADGDKMGDMISRMSTKDEHVKLSEALASFATEAGDIVGRHNGALVYSGGDDVLAFLPLENALDCAKCLSDAFRDIVKKDVNKATLSCGISIAHCHEHLQNLLDWGRIAERAAKDNGRDSLAVHLHTRTNGSDYIGLAQKWDEYSTSCDWSTWIKMHEAELISEGYAYELRELQREFQAIGHADVMLKESKRIMKRKMSRKGKEKIAQETVDKLCKSIDESSPASITASIDILVQGLIISKQIAVSRKVAGVTEEGGSDV